jgi:outer membrane protein OmpA-like peptidoglycan-associated protein
MKPSYTTIIASAGLAALVASGTANAAQHPSTPSQNEEAIGVFSGMAIGAVAGGPFGAIAGMTVGALLGHRFDAKKHEIATLDKRLEESDQTIAQLAAELSKSQERVAALNEELRTQPLPSDVRASVRGDVLFRTNDTTLNGDTEAQLTQLAQALARVPDVVVKVEGYADPRGTESENLKLSGDRAEAVRAALMAGGIADSRIVVVAHGEDGASTSEGDVDGYALNRRVVITLEGANAQVAQSATDPSIDP